MDLQTHLGKEFELNQPLPNIERQSYLSQLERPLPGDYVAFMQLFNGGEGPVGDESYIRLERLEDLQECNASLAADHSAADYTIFASDGGNAVFAFNKAGEVIEFDLIGLEPEEAINHALSFTEFLKSLLR